MSEAAREGQLRSAFTPILETLIESCVGAEAAGLVDEEGECVDHATSPSKAASEAKMIAYDIKLAGAYWQIVIRQAAEKPHFAQVSQLCIQADAFDYVIDQMFAGYVLIIIGKPGSSRRVSHRALRQVEVELAVEAGWPVPRAQEAYWRRIHVRTGHRGRPTHVSILRHSQDGARYQDAWQECPHVEPVASSGGESFERAFRVQMESGPELDIVREPSGFWYASGPAPTPGAPSW